MLSRSNHPVGFRSSRALRWAQVLACLVLLAWGALAQAAVDLTVQRVTTPDLTLEKVHLHLAKGTQGHMTLALTAARVDMKALGWHRVAMTLTGDVTRGHPGQWSFDGSIQLQGAPGGVLDKGQVHLVVDGEANNLSVAVVRGSTRVDAALPLDQPTHAQIKLEHLPMRWLQGLLADAWSGKLSGGSLSGMLALDVSDTGIRSSGDLSLTAGSFDSADGKLAGQDLAARGHVTFDADGKNNTLSVDLALHGGQLLLGPVYVALPAHDVHLAVSAVMQRYTTQLNRLRFTDPGALHLTGSMLLGAGGKVDNVHLDRFSADLSTASQRYGKAWLATLGYPDLRAGGQVEGSLWVDSHGLRSFRLQADGVDLHTRRLTVKGLDGGLDWRRGADRPATTLSWQGLDFYRIAFGPARSRWQSRQGRLTLEAPLDMSVLGGSLHVHTLTWNPQSGSGQHLQTSLALTDVDVSALSKALGWPEFPGTLAGSVPGLRYVGDRVELDGGLALNVFGGFVDVTQLSVQHPFGALPVLTGDVSLHRLDLASMTSVFDFGRITGRLNGSVDDLRMVDWKPVAFKASLLTGGDGGRISQRAVNNLTSVGGGGMASGLQGAVLKLFDSFGYRRIGLKCTLEGSVCHMSGLEPSGDGFLIVQGRGLPHLSVIGHQRKVSWPILVSRLQSAIHGGGPVVEKN